MFLAPGSQVCGSNRSTLVPAFGWWCVHQGWMGLVKLAKLNTDGRLCTHCLKPGLSWFTATGQGTRPTGCHKPTGGGWQWWYWSLISARWTCRYVSFSFLFKSRQKASKKHSGWYDNVSMICGAMCTQCVCVILYSCMLQHLELLYIKYKSLAPFGS